MRPTPPILVLIAVVACTGPRPPSRSAPPRTGPPTTMPGAVPPPRPAARSVEQIATTPPRTLASVHLAHVAQLEIARRDPPNDLEGPAIQEVWRGLGEVLGRATPEDVSLARDLARAAPRLARRILDALTSGGVAGERREAIPAVARLVDDIVLDGPAEAKAWALENEYGGADGDARAFVRTMLERAAATGRCPPADETLARAVDALLGTRQGVPCVDAAPASPAELARHPVVELLALIETGGPMGDGAAAALRTKIQEADPRTPGSVEAVLGAAEFGRIVELAARGAVERSLVMQLLTSAHDAPGWVDWLAAHPDRVGAAEREMVVLLLDSDARPSVRDRNRGAIERLRGADATLPPAGRQFRMPDDSPASFAATWRLAAEATEIGALEGVYGELMRRTVADERQRVAAARHDREIVSALGRCEALVAARPTQAWIDRALRQATADACSYVARLAASVYTPRIRAALVDALRTGPDPWVVEVYDAIDLAGHPRDVPSAVLDAMASRPEVRARLVMRPGDSFWARVPASERTESAVLTAVARAHAETLLGATPDRIGPPQPAASSSPTFPQAFRIEVSSSELPDIPPQTLLLGVFPHDGELRPTAVARIVP